MSLVFIFGHFLASSLLIATAFYFLISRVLSGTLTSSLPGGAGARRRGAPGQGLFGGAAPQTGGAQGGPQGNGGELEFGYCFDVAIRAFFPLYLCLYVIQFILMPLISRDYW